MFKKKFSIRKYSKLEMMGKSNYLNWQFKIYSVPLLLVLEPIRN